MRNESRRELRPHRLYADGALNLNQLRDCFAWSASKTVDISNNAIGDKTFYRSDFRPDSFSEFYFRSDTDLNYMSPNDSSYGPVNAVTISSHDDTGTGVLSWSAEAITMTDSVTFMLGWPCIGTLALWGAEDYASMGYDKNYFGVISPTPDPFGAAVDGVKFPLSSRVCLSGQATFSIPNGSFSVVLMFFSRGRVKIEKASFSLLRQIR